MIDKSRLDAIAEVIDRMYNACLVLEEAYKSKDAGALEQAKREILEYQKKLSLDLR